MALISARQLLDHAAEHGYAVPAFNINNMEQIHAILQAAEETASPVVLQASAGARRYAGEPFLRHLVLAAAEAYPDLPIVAHLDHGASPAACVAAIRSGFTSVMMDGSLREDARTPASYAYNLEVTRKVVELAHAVGVSVEGELGCIGSLETHAAAKEDGAGAEGPLDSRDAAHRSRSGRGLRRADRGGRARDCDRHVPRGVQVLAPPDWRAPGHRPSGGDPPARPGDAPRDARLELGAAGVARDHPRPRRGASRDLRRPDRGISRRASGTASARSTSTPTSASR